MNEFDRIVEKQEEIEQLKRDKKALIERLNACQCVIEIATDSELLGEDIHLLLCGELAPNEELLIKLK